MRWLKRLLGKPALAEVHVEPDVQFLGEQDGPPERDVKARWTPILVQCPSVQRAYLPIITLDRSATYHPALCIRSSAGDDPLLVDRLAAVFKERFAQSQMLDIMFVSAEQEEQLKRVCRPFYENA
jgi:hypothetical protein